MPDGREFGALRRISVAAVLALGVECIIVRCYLAQQLPSWMPLSAHFAVSLGLAAWVCRSPALRADVRLPLLLAASTAALGPIGAAGTLLTIVVARWYARKAVPFEEWYESLFPDTSQDASAQLFDKIALAGGNESAGLAAFADVLAFGSLSQKQALIGLINRHFQPAFGPVLKKALTDGSNAVRVQAATAMNKIETSILERTLELSRRVREAPADVEALRLLARHYDDYVYSGILDARREEQIRSLALEAYRQCIALEPADPGLRLAGGRLLLRGKQYEEASEWLGQAIQAGLSTPQATLWYMESLFQSGHFDKLRQLARNQRGGFENLGDFPSSALEAVRLWSGGALAEVGNFEQS